MTERPGQLVRVASAFRDWAHEGYGQDKPERCSKPAWLSSMASAFGAAEGPIAGGAVCSLKPLTRSFGPKAPGSLKSERGVSFRERVFSEARVSTLGGPTARSLAPLLSRRPSPTAGFGLILAVPHVGPPPNPPQRQRRSRLRRPPTHHRRPGDHLRLRHAQLHGRALRRPLPVRLPTLP